MATQFVLISCHSNLSFCLPLLPLRAFGPVGMSRTVIFRSLISALNSNDYLNFLCLTSENIVKSPETRMWTSLSITPMKRKVRGTIDSGRENSLGYIGMLKKCKVKVKHKQYTLYVERKEIEHIFILGYICVNKPRKDRQNQVNMKV